MRFTGSFVGTTVDVNAYIAILDGYLGEQLEEGAKRWVEATTGRVPLWSGMARASLLKIAELANGKVVLSPLKGKSRVPTGRSLGHGEIVARFPNYFFNVSTSVPHYTLQEVKNIRAMTGRGSPSAPWHSFIAGQAAFVEFSRSITLPPVVFKRKVIKRF